MSPRRKAVHAEANPSLTLPISPRLPDFRPAGNNKLQEILRAAACPEIGQVLRAARSCYSAARVRPAAYGLPGVNGYGKPWSASRVNRTSLETLTLKFGRVRPSSVAAANSLAHTLLVSGAMPTLQPAANTGVPPSVAMAPRTQPPKMATPSPGRGSCRCHPARCRPVTSAGYLCLRTCRAIRRRPGPPSHCRGAS